MLVLAIIISFLISVLILLALLRYGLIVEYSNGGYEIWFRIGFIKILSTGEGTLKARIKKKLKEMKLERFEEFLEVIKAVLKAFGRLRRRLRINQLTVYYTSASDDPSEAAIEFGAANAIIGAIVPVLEKYFRIKHRDLRVRADFKATAPEIYVKVDVSLSTWEVFYILFALFSIEPALAERRLKSKRGMLDENDIKERKDGQNNGETTDQRLDGDHDAKNKGDD